MEAFLKVVKSQPASHSMAGPRDRNQSFQHHEEGSYHVQGFGAGTVPPWFHTDRVTGSNRNHRRLGRLAGSRRAKSSRSRKPHELFQQPQANGPGPS